MINLIGVDRNDNWLAVEGAELYWYGKEVRVGRKVGHINLTSTDKQQLNSSLGKLAVCFPEPYPQVFGWVAGNLR